MSGAGGGTLRIIAGTCRGRRIRTIDAPGTRPMTDRVRENLFNILAPRLAGAAFLDLFAGSGAVGIEALSRGAASARFVEYSPKWCAVIEENLRTLALSDRGRIEKGDAYASVAAQARAGNFFDIVFVGAPYDEDHHNRMVRALIAAPVCAADGVIVLQYRHGDPLDTEILGEQYTVRIRDYGITSLTFIERRDT
jgi:16S rRNA (guanine966-N2)-methyltransferase